MTQTAIISGALSPWDRAGNPRPMAEDLAIIAIEALRKAGMRPADIDAIVCTTSAIPFDSPSYITLSAQLMAQRLAEKMGSHGAQCFNVSGACASGAMAFTIGNYLIKSGSAKNVLVAGIDNSPPGFFFQCPSVLDTDLASCYPHKVIGATNPTYWAMWAHRRAYEMGKSIEEIKHLMALVKHYHSLYGVLNPYARFRRVFTVEEVLASPIVCDPLHLYMIGAVSSGAGAIILTDLESAKKYTNKPVVVAASAVGGPVYGDSKLRLIFFAFTKKHPPFTEMKITVQRAYKEAGITQEDVEIMEVHDTSVFNTLLWIDVTMDWEREETDKLVKDGQIKHDGKLPVNLSGGTASFGESVQNQILVELYEIFLQLRGEAGERQAKKNLKIGLATAYGLLGSYGAVVLEKAW
ncbi:MAG: hypothetical protein QXH24_00020 [Candidatus Bathyarchaeia archaeon]